MTILDWRQLTSDQVASLYAEQAREWRELIGWDLSASWGVVERARAAGALPGLVSLGKGGVIDGWTFFLRQQDVVQIGALTGHGAGPVRRLLEAVLDAPETAGARELTCLLYPARPNALSALRRRRFDLQPLRHLARSTATYAEEPPAVLAPDLSVRRWRDEDAVACVRLLARAHGRDQTGRTVAPHGTLDEWAHYLGQILRTPACGRLLPRASHVVEEHATGNPVGLLLGTVVGPVTAHVAHLAVDPQWRRRGAARALLQACGRAAALEHLDQLTVLVTGANADAAGLFASAGFTETGQFMFASRLMPVRRQNQRRHAA